ncbi:mitochondrial carrier [Wolfiporia cocos MD-104 SS10]|uniref:Mitochondrial carrier n=1 Tax=Wolfiporia cocos (strain MD-104) TaxID=742152 RepID=A0A2H3J1R5_WOLCO|nr:mitochondrial carrier [Wolfiporia cocos MD-104 SS10]
MNVPQAGSSHEQSSSASDANMNPNLVGQQMLSAFAALAASMQQQSVAPATTIPSAQQSSVQTTGFPVPPQFGFPVPNQQLFNPFLSAVPGGLPAFMQLPAQQNTAMSQIPALSAQPTGSVKSLNTHVGSRVDDEEILINAIISGRNKGVTARQVLENLHGVNDHTAGSWKDYYLEHHYRLLDKIFDYCDLRASARNSAGSQQAASISMIKTEKINSKKGAKIKKNGPKKAGVSVKPEPRRRSSGNRNSKSYAPPVSALNAETFEIPSPPSRSPTPPSEIVPVDSHRNRFTMADDNYMIKTIQWQLRQDPATTTPSLAKRLAEKAPHHPLASWTSRMYRYRDLVGRLYTVGGGHSVNDAASTPCGSTAHDDDDESYKDSNVAANEDEHGEGAQDVLHYAESNSSMESIGAGPDTDEDIDNMGESGGPYTDADVRVLARHVAATPDWDPNGSTRRNFEPFHWQHAHRTWKAWAEFYRKKRPAIDKLARKFRRRNERQQVEQEQLQDEEGSEEEHEEQEANALLEQGRPDERVIPESSHMKRGLPEDAEDPTAEQVKRQREDEFDTIKTRLQCSPPGTYRNAIDCLLRTVRNESIFALYKGATPPAVGWAAIDSVLLGSLHNYRLFLIRHNMTEPVPGSDARRLTLAGHGVAGLFAGLTSAFLATPMELLKVKLQMQLQRSVADRQFRGPIDCARQTVQSQGITALWTGFTGSLAFRSNFLWMFLSFEALMRGFSQLKGTPYEISTPLANFMSGGLGSFAFWLMAIPADNVKNRMMTAPLDTARPSFIGTVRNIYARDGPRGFYRGLGPCFVRAFPVNASALWVYEGLMRILGAEKTRH